MAIIGTTNLLFRKKNELFEMYEISYTEIGFIDLNEYGKSYLTKQIWENILNIESSTAM